MKNRLDVLLVNRGLAESRSKAQGLIMAGVIYVDGQRVDKPGTAVMQGAQIELRGDPNPYVSRGGLKLAKALEVFPIVVQGKSAVDVGASTGGFTDCLLQNGAASVIAIDVGYGQLDWRLRQDPRVIVMERTNIRNVLPHHLPGPVDIATVDVAFISLSKILDSISALLVPDGEIIALVKPQFEAGRDQVGKKGVVRDPKIHQEVVTRVLNEAARIDLGLLGLTFSPITGPEGNFEFLAFWQKGVATQVDDYAKLSQDIVKEAHLELGTPL